MYKLLLTAFATLSLLAGIHITWMTRSFMAQGHYDFLIFYTGAEIVNEGKGQDLYDLKLQQTHQMKFKLPKRGPCYRLTTLRTSYFLFYRWPGYRFKLHILFGQLSASFFSFSPASHSWR
jgi:hypothetical protein